jgi:DNA polymerase III subunit beta
MDFATSRDSLLTAINSVIGVVERRQTLPILGNLLVSAKGDRVTLTGSDLEVEVRADFDAKIVAEGETTVPARKLADICRNLADDIEVRVRMVGERCLVTSGRGRFALGYLSASGYPTMEADESEVSLSVPEADLKRLLDKTAFAMAQQDVRYYLNGLFLNATSDGLLAVATDGHRLAKYALRKELEIGEERAVILPNKTVMELRRQLGAGSDEVQVDLGEKTARIRSARMAMTSKLVDGKYPEYERVIPRDVGEEAVIDKEGLRKALSRTAILSNEKYRGVRLNLTLGVLKLLAHNPEQEEAEEEIAVEYDGTGFGGAFNVSYMMDVLGAIEGDRVQIQFQEGNKSSLWRGLGVLDETYVIMPMRI